MTAYKLKLNDDKTEFMLISSKHRLKKVEGLSFHLGATEVSSAWAARNLSVMMDSAMSMDAQVTDVCKSA